MCVCVFIFPQAFRDCPEEMEKTHTLSAGPSSRTRFYDSYSTVRRPDQRTKISVRQEGWNRTGNNRAQGQGGGAVHAPSEKL